MDSTTLLTDLNKSVYSNLNSTESFYFRKQQIEIEKELSPLDEGEIKDLILFWSFIDLFNAIKMGMTNDFVDLKEVELPEINLAFLMVALVEQKPIGTVNRELMDAVMTQLLKLNNTLSFCHYFSIFASNCQKFGNKPNLLKSIFNF